MSPKTRDRLNLDIRSTPDPQRRNIYTPRSKGKRYGMGICQFWAYLFQLNESLPRKRKMTDEEVKRQILLEFSHRKAVKKLGKVGEKGQVTINHYRQMYNTGRFTSGIKPTSHSRRYGEDGHCVDPRTGKPPESIRRGQRKKVVSARAK